MKRRRTLLAALALLALAGGGYLGWRAWNRKPKEDLEAANAANLRGVGHMERLQALEIEKAREYFEEALKHAPSWRTAKVNLGIALLNLNNAESLAEARKVLGGVLREDPDDLRA